MKNTKSGKKTTGQSQGRKGMLQRSNMGRIPNGTKVRITGSDWSHVHIGDLGKINGDYGQGYGVDIHKFFPSALPHDRGKVETRCVFFRYDQVEEYDWKEEENK